MGTMTSSGYVSRKYLRPFCALLMSQLWTSYGRYYVPSPLFMYPRKSPSTARTPTHLGTDFPYALSKFLNNLSDHSKFRTVYSLDILITNDVQL